jgi:hypothetical protein
MARTELGSVLALSLFVLLPASKLRAVHRKPGRQPHTCVMYIDYVAKGRREWRYMYSWFVYLRRRRSLRALVVLVTNKSSESGAHLVNS